jgi:hypothetical protein
MAFCCLLKSVAICQWLLVYTYIEPQMHEDGGLAWGGRLDNGTSILSMALSDLLNGTFTFPRVVVKFYTNCFGQRKIECPPKRIEFKYAFFRISNAQALMFQPEVCRLMWILGRRETTKICSSNITHYLKGTKIRRGFRNSPFSYLIVERQSRLLVYFFSYDAPSTEWVLRHPNDLPPPAATTARSCSTPSRRERDSDQAHQLRQWHGLSWPKRRQNICMMIFCSNSY